nr:hypothetical protein [uncultured Rhodoferax sp.]
MKKGSLRIDEILERAALILIVASIAIPALRYLVYCIPAFAILTLLANRKISISEPARPYLLIVLCGLILLPFGTTEGAKDIYLILAGLSVSLIGQRILPTWMTIFLFCAAGFFVNIVSKGAAGFESISINIGSSQSSFESGFSFIFGMLAIWAAYEKQWRNFLIATIFAFLTLKRIVIIGIFFCVFIQLIPKKISFSLLRPAPMILINLLAIAMLLFYGYGYFDHIILEYTGKSANAFGMGRKVLYSSAAREVINDPLQFLIGSGPGEAYRLATDGSAWQEKENLHSDVIKIFTEYGILVFSTFVYLLYSSKKTSVMVFAVYTNLLLMTDNTLIYPYYIYFALLILACILQKENALLTHVGKP